MADSPQGRLDSWKAIAAYLGRDVGTARRWERELGLPVRRLPGGRGRSVFAYAAEIDAWLGAAPSGSAVLLQSSAQSTPRSSLWPRRVAVVALALLLVAVAWRFRGPRLRAEDLRLDVDEHGVVALDTQGAERWRYPFPPAYSFSLPFTLPAARVMTGPNPAVYVATQDRARRLDSERESGALLQLSLDGTLLRSFSFTDQVKFKGTTYGEPWSIQHFAIDDSGGHRRISVTVHHHVWSPSLVTVLDDRWQRVGTFAHYGWVEAAHWLAPSRLVIAGFSNAHDGGMVALLDPNALDGQGPEPPGTEGYCETCGHGRPLKMIVMPRTELNRLTVSRFNRAVVQVTPDRIVARTFEIWSANDVVDALYEFTPGLDLIKASFSERYWEMHLALERQGVVTHTREQCPDKDGPREIQVWEPDTGWRMRTIR